MKDATTPRPVDVVVQTHWDREWYLPHQTSVARLIEVMARVLPMLEDGRLQTFLFDGQTAAYEDLMAQAEPALAARARALAAQGRLLLGPWYVMADEFLVSGESLLRNLEIGLADTAAAAGRPNDAAATVGYLPDTFGHVAQMPMLLRQFGIGSAVLWRGADAEHSEFDWAAPDGSVVGVVFLSEGYYQHPLNLPGEAGRVALQTYLDRIARRALSPQLLLTQGGDHLLPATELSERMRAFNAAQGVYRLRSSTLGAHVAAALEGSAGRRQRLSGELRHNRQAFVLPDVLSTRRGLKHLHQQMEDRLLGEAEPLLAQRMPLHDWPAQYLEQTWRLLLQQQAHDSICGCSTDAVHREMFTRFAQLAQRLDALRDRAAAAGGLQALLQHEPAQPAAGAAHAEARCAAVFDDDGRLTLFNPLPQAFEGWQVVEVLLRAEAVAAVSVSLAGPSGAVLEDALASDVAVPARLLSVAPDTIFRSPLDDFPDRLPALRCEVALRVSVPGLGALALHIRAIGPSAEAETPPVIGASASPGFAPAPAASTALMQNQWLAVAIDEKGLLSVTHRATGHSQRGVLAVQHEFDAGDSYNFSPPHGVDPPRRQVQTRWQLLAAHQHGPVQELHLSLAMTVPAALAENRRCGSEHTVVNEGQLRLRLVGDEPAIHARLSWHNRACDQRTRLLWPCGNLAALTHTHADTAFAWLRRPVALAQVPATPTRAEAPVAVNPSLSALSAGPWWLAHRAMQEFEIESPDVDEPAQGLPRQAQLALTLVRSVGWMSRRDLRARGVGAGPDMATPDAQCLGTEVFDFRFGLQPGADEVADRLRCALALDHARRLRRPLVALRGHATHWREAVDIGNPRVQVSAVRRLAALPGAPLEIRLWNPDPSPQPLALKEDEWEAVRADGMPWPEGLHAADAAGKPMVGGRTWSVAGHGLLTLRRRACASTPQAPSA